ncbi:MAG TPA: AAA family ATPase, partial [Solirubrobacteraceae bacterium]|nr:AAA family ATPase [Solirubrobacteraceae bacterium]
MNVFEVLWSEADSGEVPLPLPTLIEASRARGFAARKPERAQLAGVLEAAEAGARQVVLISGEPGIGKTALATELAIGAHEGDMPVLYGRCEEDAALPFEPFVEALDHLIAQIPDALVEQHVAEHGGELIRIVPHVRARAEDAPEPRSADPVSERYALFEAVADVLARAAHDTPLLILLDDLHWAEHSTLQLLRHLVGQLIGAPVVLIGTYRGGELEEGHPLIALLADLHREQGITRIELAGFDEPDVVALMEVLAGHELDSDGEQLAGVLQRETSGNPFFIREVLRNLRETGQLKQSKGRWSSDPAVALPTSVREVIGRRVERLGEFARHALATGAIIGREFDAELLLRALDADEDELADALDSAVRAGLIRELPGCERKFEFAHALVEYTLYDSIGPARRRRGHQRVAAALEELCAGRTDSRIAELAYHFRESASSADVPKAVAYATRAGDRALEQLAPDEGVAWYEQALRLQGDAQAASVEERCELLIRLGEAQGLAGLSQQRETLFEAAELARRVSDSARLVRAALANERGRLYSEP